MDNNIKARNKWARYIPKNNSCITSIIKGKPERKRPIQSYKKQIELDLGK